MCWTDLKACNLEFFDRIVLCFNRTNMFVAVQNISDNNFNGK